MNIQNTIMSVAVVPFPFRLSLLCAPWWLFRIYFLTPATAPWMNSPIAAMTFFSFCPSPLNENFWFVSFKLPVLGYLCTLKSPEVPLWLKSSASEQDTINWLPVTSPVTSSSEKLASPSTTATSVTPESSAPAATASGHDVPIFKLSSAWSGDHSLGNPEVIKTSSRISTPLVSRISNDG